MKNRGRKARTAGEKIGDYAAAWPSWKRARFIIWGGGDSSWNFNISAVKRGRERERETEDWQVKKDIEWFEIENEGERRTDQTEG